MKGRDERTTVRMNVSVSKCSNPLKRRRDIHLSTVHR